MKNSNIEGSCKYFSFNLLRCILFFGLVFNSMGFSTEPLTEHPETDSYQGWQLGVQAWSFRKYTFFEAIDKARELGLNWIEAYPGQSLSKEYPQVKFDENLTAGFRKLVKKKLSQCGVKLVNFGVVKLTADEKQCIKVFEFAKSMGIETIVSEPPAEAFEMLDELCEEYEISIAIHNHPKPSVYWSPDKVLEMCQGRSKWIGACCDTGHWVRSGLDPVECIKKLKGRIVSLHLKEISDGHDVIWGTAENRVGKILAELNKQKFKGVFSIEYEHNWTSSMPEISECVKFFEKTGSALAPSGWDDLLKGDLSNWIFKKGSWEISGGNLTLVGGSYIWSKEQFGDFILDFEFKVEKGGNSGVFFRTSNLSDIVNTGIEVQIHDTTDGNKYGMCGAIYDCFPPKRNMMLQEQWNRMTLMALDNNIYVVMNGKQIIDMDLNQWTEAHKNPDGTKNKFKYAYKDMARKGHIGFQDHGNAVWFRNIKIKKL